MSNSRDPDVLKIPAYMRKKMIVSQAKQKLILTALDRKDAGLDVHSKKATAPSKTRRPRITGVAPRRSRAVSPVFDAPMLAPSEPITPVEPTPTFTSAKLPAIGTVTHYLEKIEVAIIMLSAPLAVGETIIMCGDECLFAQPVTEMQIDRKDVNKAKKGSHIGLKVNSPAKVNSSVYRLPG